MKCTEVQGMYTATNCMNFL